MFVDVSVVVTIRKLTSCCNAVLLCCQRTSRTTRQLNVQDMFRGKRKQKSSVQGSSTRANVSTKINYTNSTSSNKTRRNTGHGLTDKHTHAQRDVDYNSIFCGCRQDKYTLQPVKDVELLAQDNGQIWTRWLQNLHRAAKRHTSYLPG